MKKTYMTPEVLAVALLPKNSIVEGSIHDINSGSDGPGYEGADDPTDPGYEGGYAKGFTSKDLWDNEW